MFGRGTTSAAAVAAGKFVEKPTWHTAGTCLGSSQQRGVIKV